MDQQLKKVERELSRIESEYIQRDSGATGTLLSGRYSLFNQAALLHAQSLERDLLALLKRHACTDLLKKKVLDVGCGNGRHLHRFLDYGACLDNLFGIDLMTHRIEQARQRYPAIHWQVGSAHQLPYQSQTFDLVMSFVVFSSILNDSLRQLIACEMWRVLKPGGLILFYDFTYSNPRNSAVQGISHSQIRTLFDQPGVTFDFRRSTLAPPIARMLAPRAYGLAFLLERLKFLNTHVIGIISQQEHSMANF